ncbi:MAG: hypothetical protein QOG07_299, partial [Pseudonocardiales bacterium]|nr:hypothetical protein [Pseudonocardiales bacterium]
MHCTEGMRLCARVTSPAARDVNTAP